MYKNRNLLDKDILRDLLDNFSKATGIYIDAVDENGKSLIENRKFEMSGFCKHIKSINDGNFRCQQSYKKAYNECNKWSEPYFFRCHTGLVMWSTPIVIDDKQIGAIICGQVLLWKPDKFFFEELEDFNKNICDLEKLKQNVLELNVISPDRCKSVATMMSIFVNYLVNRYNKLFIEEREVLEWRNCVLNEIQERKRIYKSKKEKFDNSVYIKREKALLQYIRTGNKEEVKKRLPNIFSDIDILSEFNLELVKDFSIELMGLISRACIEGGIDSDLSLSIFRRFKKNINQFKTSGELFNNINITILTLMDMIYISGNENQNKILESARSYIDKNYNMKITNDDIAESIYISKYYLCHLFRDNLNMSIKEYITRIRIEKAVELMKKRELTINDIMKEVGINSRSYFSKSFKKIIGVTPGVYRNKFL